MLRTRKAHCHPRLPKPILEFLSMDIDTLKKQLSQAKLCSEYGLQIASYTEISIIFY